MKKEQKNRFINEAFATIGTESHSILKKLEFKDLRMADLYFRLVEDYEDRLQTELAEFRFQDYDKMVECVMDEIELSDYAELFRDKSDLKVSFVRTTYLYSRWCRSNKLPARDDISRSREVKLMKYQSTIVKSPEHLQLILNLHLDPVEMGSADLCCRGAAWLSYAGLTEDEVVNTSADDIDFQRGILSVKRNGSYVAIKLPKQSIPCLAKLAVLDSFRSYRKIYKDIDARKSGVEYKRVDSSSIIRGVDTGRGREKLSKRANASKLIINNIFNRHKRGGALESLTHPNLWKCGFFYRAYLEEKQSGGAIFRLDESQLGWERDRSVKRFNLTELDQMLELQIQAASAITSKRNAGFKERYWRNTIYNEYSIWKQSVETKKK